MEGALADAAVRALATLGPVATLLGIGGWVFYKAILKHRDAEIQRLHNLVDAREKRIDAQQNERNELADKVILLMDQTVRLLEGMKMDVTNRELMQRLEDLRRTIDDAIKDCRYNDAPPRRRGNE